MDCAKFEAAMMDELYGELDELTSAAAKRHVAGCADCAALIGGLRATRRLAIMPLVEPPADLEGQILAAVKSAQKVVPLRRKIARAVSVAGSWAMRPQTAMAAVFLVMIGTSALLLRGKSARAPASADVTVTEQGTPAPAASVASPTATPPALGPLPPVFGSASPRAEPKAGAASPPAATAAAEVAPDDPAHAKALAGKDDDLRAPSNASMPGGVGNALPPSPQGGASGGLANRSYASPPAQEQAVISPFDVALQTYRSGRFEDAARAFDALAPSDSNAGLWAARSVREAKGCRAAVSRFDRISQRASGTSPGWDALLEGAICYRGLGDFGGARVRLNALLNVDSHKDRARAELDRLDQAVQGRVGGVSATAARAAPARPAASQAPSTSVDSAY